MCVHACTCACAYCVCAQCVCAQCVCVGAARDDPEFVRFCSNSIFVCALSYEVRQQLQCPAVMTTVHCYWSPLFFLFSKHCSSYAIMCGQLVIYHAVVKKHMPLCRLNLLAFLVRCRYTDTVTVILPVCILLCVLFFCLSGIGTEKTMDAVGYYR